MDINKFLQENDFITHDGLCNDHGWELFSILLDQVGLYPDLTPGIMPSPYGIFDKLLSKIVPASQELVLLRDKKIFLTYRDDKWWKGWHLPGSNIKPRESLLQTCQRIADNEIPGIEIKNAELISTVSAIHNPRFHNMVIIVKADFDGEPTGGEWFSSFPPDFLDVQRCYIPFLLQFFQE